MFFKGEMLVSVLVLLYQRVISLPIFWNACYRYQHQDNRNIPPPIPLFPDVHWTSGVKFRQFVNFNHVFFYVIVIPNLQAAIDASGDAATEEQASSAPAEETSADAAPAKSATPPPEDDLDLDLDDLNLDDDVDLDVNLDEDDEDFLED